MQQSQESTTMLFSVLEEKYTSYIKECTSRGDIPLNPVDWLKERLDSPAKPTEQRLDSPARSSPAKSTERPPHPLAEFAAVLEHNGLLDIRTLMERNRKARAELAQMRRDAP